MATDTHEPIQKAYHEKMNVLARFLDEQFNGDVKMEDRETGFILLVFPFGTNSQSRCNYISNGSSRKDIAVLFREMAARFEGQSGESGTA